MDHRNINFISVPLPFLPEKVTEKFEFPLLKGYLKPWPQFIKLN